MQVQINNKNFILKNQDKVLLNIDWLTINLDDIFQDIIFDEKGVFEKSNFHLHLRRQRTQNFNKMIDLYFFGEKVATILSESNSKLMFVGVAQIKFENFLFYSGQLQSVYLDLKKNFKLKNIKISRLDLCLDGVFLHEFLNYNIYETNQNFVKLVGDNTTKFNNINHNGANRENYRSANYDMFTIGRFGNEAENSNRSYKFIRYYNKSKEIEKSKKEYILNHWKSNGFDVSKNVYRFEFQLSSKFFNRYFLNNSFEDIFKFEILEQMFMTATKRTFEFRHNDNANLSRCTPIQIFTTFSKSIFTLCKKITKDNIRTIKIAVKRLKEDCLGGLYQTDKKKKKFVDNFIQMIVKDYNLHEWYKHKLRYIQQDQYTNAVLTGNKLNYVANF